MCGFVGDLFGDVYGVVVCGVVCVVGDGYECWL